MTSGGKTVLVEREMNQAMSRDALSMQSVSTIIFLYFANLAPIVAFGGLLGDATDNRMASIEALVSFLWFLQLTNLGLVQCSKMFDG